MLYNESIKYGHDMGLYEYEKKHNYVKFLDYTESKNDYFHNNTIGMYIPKDNGKSKCTYIFNRHLAYTRLNQVANDYLFNEIKYDNNLRNCVSDCIKTYKSKSNVM